MGQALSPRRILRFSLDSRTGAREMKRRFWRGLEGYIWISWVYLERFFFFLLVLFYLGRVMCKSSTPPHSHP